MKAQSYALDLILAVVFTSIIAVVLLLVFYQPPSVSQQQIDAKALSSAVLLAYPSSYTQDTVLSPGFVVNQRLDLDAFAAFESLPHVLVKQLVGIESDFLVTVTDAHGLFLSAGVAPTDASDVHVVRRYVAHNGSIATVEVIAWQ